MRYLYQSNPSQVDWYTDAEWAGDATRQLSNRVGAWWSLF